MFRTSATRRGASALIVLGGVLAAGAAIFLAISFYLWNRHITGQIATSGLPECPHYWETFKIPHGPTIRLENGLSVSGRITSVPEFHDCQRFVNRDSTYGPLVAIFASFRLDSLSDSLYRLNKNETFITGTRITSAVTVAEVFNQDPVPYPALGIAPGFNCLHLYYDAGTLKAQMVRVGSTEADCLKPFDPTTGGGTPLQVTVKPITGFTATDYPPVVRWDWDDSAGHQYVGIKCGTADWCEIGRTPLTPSLADLDPSPATTPEARVRRIKGWYDEQYLDTATTADPSRFLPSRVKATVIPHPGLSGYTYDPGTWHLTGYVAMDAPLPYYKTKFNFDSVTVGAGLDQMNKLELCFGRRGECIPESAVFPEDTCRGFMNAYWSSVKRRWWARFTAAGDGTTIYRCVIRRGHPDVTMGVPGTTRWRWLAKDPTVWEACTNGCCEVEAGT